MAKRKYTRMGETPSKYKCTKCLWEGTSEEKNHKLEDGYLIHICPKCSNEEFYGLI